MWPGRRPATGWMAKRTSAPRVAQELGDLVERVLRLGDRHAVAGHDDHALGVAAGSRAVSAAVTLFDLALRVAARALGGRRALVGAEAAEDHAQERAVHRPAHDVAEDRAARADQRAGDDQQVVGQHEAGGRRGPARVAVEHRDHDRHVGAADGHDQVDAEDAGDRASSTGAAAAWAGRRTARRRTRTPPSDGRGSARAAPGSSSGLLPITPCSLPKATTEPVKVTAPTKTPTKISTWWMVASTPACDGAGIERSCRARPAPRRRRRSCAGWRPAAASRSSRRGRPAARR